jgi:uncharacterized protein
LVDRGLGRVDDISAVLRTIEPRLGKYAIFGNHEYYYGFKDAAEVYKAAGFKLLRDEIYSFDGISLIGADDKNALRFNLKLADELELLMKAPLNNFRILLKHQPKFDLKALPYFELMLSGHTHGGQFLPLGLFAKILFPYFRGMYDLGENRFIYVTRGVGSWGPPVRILSPPEITIIELHPID